jgi:hypothetical protein
MVEMQIAFIGDSLTAGKPGVSYFKILQCELPQDELVNMGRGNETVPSLRKRLYRTGFPGHFDLAFLWIGVNDVTSKVNPVMRLLGFRPAKDMAEFQTCYREILDLVTRQATRVMLVPPVLKGEDLQSQWNWQMDSISRLIRRLASTYAGTGFLDLRETFTSALAGRVTSDYLHENPLTVARDLLGSFGDTYVDKKSARRGLYLTLDGVHLNSRGARMAADAFIKVISG